MDTKRRMWLRLKLGHATVEEFDQEVSRIGAIRIDGEALVFASSLEDRTIEVYIDDVPFRYMKELVGKHVNGADLVRRAFPLPHSPPGDQH
ncbi:hypothetical protein [Larkinella sp.]|uniref:hypothetical protein n=1 Tax=Larkinella sp. TaxID=2034517 RepID=UPI003BA8D29B